VSRVGPIRMDTAEIELWFSAPENTTKPTTEEKL
jgi:hypothetical protein